MPFSIAMFNYQGVNLNYNPLFPRQVRPHRPRQHLLVAPQLLRGELQRQAALLHRVQHYLRGDRSAGKSNQIWGVDKRNPCINIYIYIIFRYAQKNIFFK